MIKQYAKDQSCWLQHADQAKADISALLTPGDHVRHLLMGGFGTVIAASANQHDITVLWTQAPCDGSQEVMDDLIAMGHIQTRQGPQCH